MDKLILKNCLINGVISDIEITDGVISSVAKTEEDGIDLHGKAVYPGLIDIHCHGVMGHDTMDADALEEMSDFLLKNGTTSWFPTTMTMDIETIKQALNSELPKSGANVLGFHAEGPYISPKYKGAQNEDFIKNPDINDFKDFNNIKMITLAPELSDSIDFIKNFTGVVSLGHTDCSYTDAVNALDAGAKCLTHTFNAMPPLHHREPSAIGAAFDKNAYVQVICDGIHIHPSAIRILYKLFGRDRMILISDAMRATGLSDGKYSFGGQEITVENKIARTASGALAGSTSTLMDCVKKAIGFGIEKDDAFYMATTTPATLMGLNKGKIEKGYDADLIAVDDDLNIKMTIVKGKVIE